MTDIQPADATHTLTVIADVFWTIMDMLDPTSLALSALVSRRWHVLVKGRPAASHRERPEYQVGHLLSTPTLLEWGWKHAPLRARTRFCKAAALRGDLRSLQWLRTERGAPWDEGVCAAAALGGHLAVLQWARRAGAPWNAAVLQNAAKGGHFETFRWARRAKAPWDGKVLRTAAKHGSFEIFRWCFRHRAPSMDTTERFAGYFAAAGCLSAVRWMYERELFDDERAVLINILVSAAIGGHLHVLRWLLDANLALLDKDAVRLLYDAAALNGRLAVLQWLQRHGHPPDQYVCEQAATGGHLECLRWAAAQEGVSLTPEVLVCAARSGSLQLVQWVHAGGAPWTSNVYPAAADSRSVELLRWVLDVTEGFSSPETKRVSPLVGERPRMDPDDPWRIEALAGMCCETACVEAARNGELPLLEWAAAHGAKITTRRAGVLAAKGGHLAVVEWLHAHGVPLVWDLVVEYAAAEGHLPVVRWALAHGAPREGICAAAMSGRGRFEVLRWAIDEAEAQHNGADHPMFYASLETLAWAHSRGFRIEPNHAYLEAAKCDDREMLQWVLRVFGPPGDELYKLALETRTVDFLDRLHKHGVEWAPTAKCVPVSALEQAQNNDVDPWLRVISSPWDDSEAPTDGDETSSQSDEEEFGEWPRPTQDYYESLSSGREESDGEASESSEPSDEGTQLRILECVGGPLRDKLIRKLVSVNFAGLEAGGEDKVRFRPATEDDETDAVNGFWGAEVFEEAQEIIWPDFADGGEPQGPEKPEEPEGSEKPEGPEKLEGPEKPEDHK